ncbi:MAG: hypothetical protein AB1734_08055, partial [Elusimicrobiota bacterium]
DENPDLCLEGLDYTPVVTQAGEDIVGQYVGVSGAPSGAGVPIPIGQNQSLPIGVGLELAGVSATRSGYLIVGMSSGTAERGFEPLHGQVGYFMLPHPYAPLTPEITGSLNISASYKPLGLTEKQEEHIRGVRVTQAGVRTRAVTAVDTVSDKAQFQLPLPPEGLLQFVLETPDYPNAGVVEVGDASLTSDAAGLSGGQVAPGAVADALAKLEADGLHLASGIYEYGPTCPTLDPVGVVKVPYDPLVLASNGRVLPARVGNPARSPTEDAWRR